MNFQKKPGYISYFWSKPYLILILLIALAYANSLQNAFIFDDHLLIEENPKINLPLREIPSILITPLWKFAGHQEAYQTYYRPVLSLLYVLNYKIWGPNPFGFHLTNILLHLISVMVLYRIGLILYSNNELTALIGASIFAVHPVNNEPVARAGAGEPIFGFFIILSIYFFLKKSKCLSWITFFLALLSKESAVMLPFALVILAVHKRGFKQGMADIMCYVVLVGIYFILRTMTADTVLGGGLAQPIYNTFLTMTAAAFDYIRLLIIPYPLMPFYPARWHASIFEPKVIFAIIILSLIFFLAFKIRKDRVLLFLLAFPFIMLAPVIWRVNIFPIGGEFAYIAERFLYVPAMLFSVFISAFVMRLTGESGRKYVFIGWIPIIIAFAVITVSANMIWKNDIAFFEKIAREFPETSFAHKNLAISYYKSGQLNKAIGAFQMELRIRPNNAEAHNSLGSIYYEQDKMDEARKEYLTAIRLNPAYSEAYNNLGSVYYKQGQIDEAIKQYKTSLMLQPDHPDIHYNIGNIYKIKGLRNEAGKEFEIVLKLRPDDPMAIQAIKSLGYPYVP